MSPFKEFRKSKEDVRRVAKLFHFLHVYYRLIAIHGAVLILELSVKLTSRYEARWTCLHVPFLKSHRYASEEKIYIYIFFSEKNSLTMDAALTHN